MDRKGTWITVGIVVASVTVFALTNLPARAPLRPADSVPGPESGRFQVIRSAPDHIILLDSATGDLWKAKIPEDVRPYKERIRPEVLDREGATDKLKDKRPFADLRKDDAKKDRPFADKKDQTKPVVDKDVPKRVDRPMKTDEP
jgi:hypothetical protein